MTSALLVSFVMTAVMAATPILLASLGELVAEKSGVLNLGLEGMMLIGAVVGFATATLAGSTLLGFAAAGAGGLAASLIFAALALGLSANQVATGLALTIFGTGASSLIGAPFVGRTVERLGPLFPAGLSDHPILRVVLGYDPVVYMSLALTAGIAWFLRHTRPGLILRAVGESDVSAHAIGHPVLRVRLLAVGFGGVLAGLAGAYFSLELTPMWADRLTAGRGWIALALVVFASWRAGWLLAGAYLFGAVMTLELHAKAAGFGLLPPEILAMLPYLATILVLTIVSVRPSRTARAAPACLGKAFSPA